MLVTSGSYHGSSLILGRAREGSLCYVRCHSHAICRSRRPARGTAVQAGDAPDQSGAVVIPFTGFVVALVLLWGSR